MSLSSLSNSKKLLINYSVIWLITIIISSYFRLFPLLNYAPEDASEKATLYVLAQLRSQVIRNVNQTYPDAPKGQREIIIQKSFQDLVHKERHRIRSTINDATQNIDILTQRGINYPYLLASDSFYYYALTKKIAEQGSMSDKIKGSKYFNELMLAPKGHWEPLNWHPYVGFYIYKFLRIFDPDVHLMYAVSFTPIVLTALTLMFFLFICSQLGCQPIPSMVGSLFLALAPIFIKRSTFGWYDNDPYNVLFPMLILGVLLAGLKQNISPKKMFFLAVLTSLTIMLYAHFWQGWMLFLSIISLAGILILLFNHFILKSKLHTKNLFAFFCVIIVGSFASISFAFGTKEFFILFQEGWTALQNFLSPRLSSWPDLYISVGELHNISIIKIIQLIGGYTFFSIAIVGIFYSIYQSFVRHSSSNSYFIIILFTYFITALIIASGAQRFTMLCLTPIALFFTLGLNGITRSAEDILQNKLKIQINVLKIFRIFITVIIVLLSIIPIKNIQKNIRSLLNPIFNETWDRALTQIRNETPPESIINAWWPPGHFIKAISKRRVTFDGATINFPQAYWMANVYLSQSEQEALGILRMLNNSANQATEFLQNQGYSLPTAVSIIKEITKLNEFRARMKFSALFNNKEKEDYIVSLTHKTPPPSYLLLYNEFVEKNIQLGFFGKWNFRQIEQINNNPQLLAKVPPRSSDEYISFLWQLVGGPYKYSETLSQISQIDDTVLFQHRLSINLVTKDSHISSPQYGVGIPHSIFFLLNDNVVEKKLPKANLSYSVLLLGDQQSGYRSILLDRHLARSLLVRLFHFGGKGLKYFKPFVLESDLTKRTQIQVYKVDWEKLEKDLKRQ